MLVLADAYEVVDTPTSPPATSPLSTWLRNAAVAANAVVKPRTTRATPAPSTSPTVVKPPPSMTNPPAPSADVPVAPTAPPVIITTTPVPGVDQPVQEVPGAGPVVTATTTPDSGGVLIPTNVAWWNVFDPNAFAWWKPVLIAGGIALFGGAILSVLARKRS